ncbi:3-phenylpropionate/trans-cinnamate dioxygenase ferredoxin reductase subunit [Kitasatospora sp. MAA4]|uniref:NAD(P)/FAD-dependent oxidoreductase n=1 Tax=Kitasatospora sp. MAA4 TaxID=3035093 RepID=UPI0024759BE1|nr:FAD-dependent oxidoreductase [Kitasatospora sp. MAA4]MDH6134754.1 3-phenylpropionate/trans-cinnamate dioxygenase ferredoxin reductase subunit [Kitasatospora sp. MAA4]
MAELERAEQVVVVGSGMAGAQCALALRQGGWRGGISLLGAEPHPPYDRPPLSKDVLLGKADSSVFDLDFDQLGIELLAGRRATAVRPGVLHTDAGELPYGRLVLATGADPVRLPVSDGARVLRTVDDALALRAALGPGSRLVLVGAGWIGAETATAARQLGCEVTVLEAAAEPLAGVLPRELTAPMERWYAEAGVRLRLGAKVAAVEPGAVVLADGDRVAADEVVIGIGARPATGWLADSGIELDAAGAIVADASLRTSLPLVWAAGDCVSYPSARFGERINVQHWDHAMHSGRAVAAALLGSDEPYDPVPYFWSEQFGRMVQYAGRHAAGDRMVLRGSPEDPAWSALWLREGVLVAAMAVDRPRDVVQARKLIAQGSAFDPERAADPSVALKSAVV